MIVLFSVESVDSEMANETDFSLNGPSILRTGCPDGGLRLGSCCLSFRQHLFSSS